MALTFTKKMETRMGDKKFHIYEVTHDGSVTTVNASDLNMNYIDYAIAGDVTLPTSITGAAITTLSVTGASIAVSFSNALSSGAISVIEAWGW